MALSADCVDRFLRVADDNVSTTFSLDSFIDISVTNVGLLSLSSLVIRRLTGSSVITTYTFSGTGTECLGIEAALLSCIRDMGGLVGYSDWSYP